MRARVNRVGPYLDREPPASLRPLYEARRVRSVAAVRAAIAALAAESRRVTLAAIEEVSRGLPEGAVSAKTVLRNPECRALYAAAAGTVAARRTRSSQGVLRAELTTVTRAENGPATNEPSAAELRRTQRLDRRSKRELAAMVIRLEREIETLQRHNANLRERLLRNGLGRSGRAGTEPVTAGPPTQCSCECGLSSGHQR